MDIIEFARMKKLLTAYINGTDITAYEIWLGEGNTGTVEDFLASLIGTDGREIQLQKTSTYIQWRYVGETGWTNLIALTDITGPTGATGAAGTNGTNGTDGADGESAYAAAQTGGYTDTQANFYADLAAIEGLADALAAI